MNGLLQDLRCGLRQLRTNPGSTTVAVLTLALGIAASTAVFALVDTVLLQPLPYHHPEQLVLVTESLPAMASDEIGVSAPEYLDYRDHNRSFSQVASYERAGFNLTGMGQPLRINAAEVSSSTFSLLGVSPELGRVFTENENRYGSGQVVVLSHALWRSEYSGDRNILGKTIKLDERAYTVVGVMPPSFRFPFDGAPLSEMADLWVPDAFAPDRLEPENRTREFGVGLIGRLKPGVTKEQAQQDVTNIANAFMQHYGYKGTIRVQPNVYPFAAHSVSKAKPLLTLLVLAASCVLLIACANLANLLLARAAQRRHEMAIRSALGADHRRLMRQCLVESLLLFLASAGLGSVIAVALTYGLRRFGPSDVPRLHDVALHPVAVLFALGLSVGVATFFGFIPAWRLSHTAPQESIKESTRLGSPRRTQRLQDSVVTVEIATAVVLLIACGLLVRSFVRILNSPFGFNPDHVLVVRTLFDRGRYPNPAKRQAAQEELLAGLERVPGVQAVAAASHLPLSDARQIGFRLEHAGPADYHWAENSLISPGYFHALGIPLIEGRDFNEQDRPHTPPVAIISQTLAKKYFPHQDPIGQRFQWGDRALFTIVGIVADVHISALDVDPPPMIYNSMFQVESGASERNAFVLRTREAQQGLLEEVQKQVWAVDKDLPLYNATSLSTLVSESLAQRRFVVLLLGSFGVVALTLAAVGLFGVISYLVAERTREFGVRMALGAQRSHIYWRVLGRSALMLCAGLVLGAVGSFVATRILQSMLFGVGAADPLVFLSVTVLLTVVTVLASYAPASRAAKVDPMVALRYE